MKAPQLTRVLNAALHNLALREQHVLVAVSGGADSTALLHALHSAAPEFQLQLTAAHVNHGLRGAESDADELHVRQFAQQLALPCLARRVKPAALREGQSSRARPSWQEAARQARRAALASMAASAGAECIATAHTQNDQAETLLLRLLRGAGPTALGGIAPRTQDGRVVRPLLDVSRAQVLEYARAQGLAWREDSSNKNPRYARARLRESGLSELAAAQNPNWLHALSALAESQRAEEEWLGQIVQREARLRFGPQAEGGFRIRAEGWAQTPEALARRLLRLLLREAGGARDVSKVHLLRALAFLREGNSQTGAVLQLPGGLALRRRPDCFVLQTNC